MPSENPTSGVRQRTLEPLSNFVPDTTGIIALHAPHDRGEHGDDIELEPIEGSHQSFRRAESDFDEEGRALLASDDEEAGVGVMNSDGGRDIFYRRLIQVFLGFCCCFVGMGASVTAVVLVNYASQCRLPAFRDTDVLRVPAHNVSSLIIETTGSISLRWDDKQDSDLLFRVDNFAATKSRMHKTIWAKAIGDQTVQMRASEPYKWVDGAQGSLGGYLCSGSDVVAFLPDSAAASSVRHLTLISMMLGFIDVWPRNGPILNLDSLDIHSNTGASIRSVNATIINVVGGHGAVDISDIVFDSKFARLELRSEGGALNLNLKGSGFEGRVEVHVGYGEFRIPSGLHNLIVDRQRDSYLQTVYKGQRGSGNGLIEIYANNGNDINLIFD